MSFVRGSAPTSARLIVEQDRPAWRALGEARDTCAEGVPVHGRCALLSVGCDPRLPMEARMQSSRRSRCPAILFIPGLLISLTTSNLAKATPSSFTLFESGQVRP